MLTFQKDIDRLMIAEGYDPQDKHGSEAKLFDDALVYVVNFCKENKVEVTQEIARGFLISNWSLFADADFTCPAAVDRLVKAVLDAL